MANIERIYLLDGMALVYRAYFAFIRNPLINSKGENTSAIFGFVNFLNGILSQEYPDSIAVVFDTAVPTFRHLAYKEYKATRQKMPEDMSAQIPILKDVVRAYNIPIVEVDGYEADDVIGTLALQAEKEGALSFLVTPDKDFMQLVSPTTKMYRPGKQGTDVEIIDIQGVRNKFGVTPDHVIDVLGLTGDASDNIPGVPGIGEKTAIPLVQKYGTIEGIYEHLDEILQKGVRAKLENNRELAFLSKKLVTIDTHVPLQITYHGLHAAPRNVERLSELFERLEFRSLRAKLQTEPQKPQPAAEESVIEFTPPAPLNDISTTKHKYVLIDSELDFQNLVQKLSKSKAFVFDTETTSTDALNADLVGISFALKIHEAWYIAVEPEHEPEARDLFGTVSAGRVKGKGLPAGFVCSALKPLFENSRILKIGHNIKYDALVLSRYGIAVEGIPFDTMIASYVLRADGRHSMDSLAEEYLQYKTVTYTDLTGSGKEQKDLRDIPAEKVSDYSCEDADITLQLYEVLGRKLEEQSLRKLCEEIEFPLTPVLTRMEKHGVCIDVDYLNGMSKELERQLDVLTHSIHTTAGGAFNINSTQQLAELLFNKLKLRTLKKTKTGFSTDVAVLESLRGEHPIIEQLLEFRQLAKLKSTYVDALPKLIHPATGRVHTSFNQSVTTTGRLSSSDPNFQNIPIRTEIGRSIRRAFIAQGENALILSADYSQIELRVMAHISEDEGLTEAFRRGEDIHASTAAKVFGVLQADVTRDMRRKAKEVNFGIMYGIGAYGLASRLEISQAEAKEIIARYFQRFPKVQNYINDTIARSRQQGFVSTLLGRRRYIPDINSRNQNIRQNAERQSINMPIQGTAADMIKLAMIKIDAALRENNFLSAMVLQVHDELVFEVQESELDMVKKIVSENMRNALPLNVPVEVELGAGSNWLDAH
jgi:DNA polymerase-1